jgi:hypothetical protein
MSSANSSIPLSTFQSLADIHAEINELLDLEGCLKFIELVQILRGTLSLSMAPGQKGPLERLPRNVHDFLGKCLGLGHEETKIIWNMLSPIAWAFESGPEDPQSVSQKHIPLFLQYGISRGIGMFLVMLSYFLVLIFNCIAFYHFIPPIQHCLDPSCSMKRKKSVHLNGYTPRELAEELTVNVTVFTQDLGPIPGLFTSIYCRGEYSFSAIVDLHQYYAQ